MEEVMETKLHLNNMHWEDRFLLSRVTEASCLPCETKEAEGFCPGWDHVIPLVGPHSHPYFQQDNWSSLTFPEILSALPKWLFGIRSVLSWHSSNALHTVSVFLSSSVCDLTIHSLFVFCKVASNLAAETFLSNLIHTSVLWSGSAFSCSAAGVPYSRHKTSKKESCFKKARQRLLSLSHFCRRLYL
jgi:hypothetical protein